MNIENNREGLFNKTTNNPQKNLGQTQFFFKNSTQSK